MALEIRTDLLGRYTLPIATPNRAHFGFGFRSAKGGPKQLCTRQRVTSHKQ